MAVEQDWAAYANQAYLATADTLLARTSAGAGVEISGNDILARRAPGGDYTAYGNIVASVSGAQSIIQSKGTDGIVEAYAISGAPYYRFRSAAAGTDRKLAELNQASDGSIFIGRFVNDAYTNASNWMEVYRQPSGYAVDKVLFPSAVICGSGDWTGGFAKLSAIGSGTGFRGISAYNSGSSGSARITRVDNVSVPLDAFFYGASTTVGSITTNGTATAYNTSSDYRLKEDLQPLIGALERIRSLPVYDFRWSETGERARGFMAHEFGSVIPGAATGEKDGVREEVFEVEPARTSDLLDADGNPIYIAAVMGSRMVPDYQGIDQSKAVPDLVGAVQEMAVMIEELRAEIAALKAAL